MTSQTIASAVSGESTHDPVEDALRSSLLEKIKIGDLPEIEKTINILKANSEIQKFKVEKQKAAQEAEKVRVDATLAARQLRHAVLNSIVAPLVPIASLLAVGVTLWVSTQQMGISNDQARQKSVDDKIAREETYWRAFLDELDKSTPDKLYSSPTFVARLKTFAAAGGHNTELPDITKKLMIGFSSFPAFQDMWKLQVKAVNDDNIDYVLELAKAKQQQWNFASNECGRFPVPTNSLPEDSLYTYLGACSSKYTQDQLGKAFPNPEQLKALLALRDGFTSTTSIVFFLSENISAYLRERSTTKTGPKELDLSNIAFLDADLQDVDFSKADLTQTLFSTNLLKGAILQPRKLTFDFRGATWWDAQSIDQLLLADAIVYSYPEQNSVNYPPGYKITYDEYAKNVARLCTSGMTACSKRCLRFGSGEPPTDQECN
jgi:hypothetical protein